MGGLLADGSGNEPWAADVLVRDHAVQAIVPRAHRPAGGYAAETMDVTGRVVAPGFVDIHTHSDLTLLAYPANESRVTQGVTTEVVGNCGMSPAPGAADRDGLAAMIATIDVVPDLPWTWTDLHEWMVALESAPTSTNVAVMVGHGSARFAVSGSSDSGLSDPQAMRLHEILAHALDIGCLGVSLGLMYAPGEHADAAEIALLARVVAQRGGLLAAHLRDYRPEHLPRAIEELLVPARDERASLQISHLRAIGDVTRPAPATSLGGFAGVVAHVAAARDEIDVAADVYPYVAGHTTLVQLLPSELRSLGPAAVAEACRRDTATVARLLADAGYGAERITVMKAPASPDAVGLQVDEAGADPWGWLVGLLDVNDANVDIAVESGRWEDVDHALATPWVCVASDGMALDTAHTASVAHPRSWGAFPAAYRRMRQLGIPVGEAVRRMTVAPAERVGLRAGVSVGRRADLVVFDDDTFDSPASLTRPTARAVGIDHVLVSGEHVVRNGATTAARPGQLLRRAA